MNSSCKSLPFSAQRFGFSVSWKKTQTSSHTNLDLIQQILVPWIRGSIDLGRRGNKGPAPQQRILCFMQKFVLKTFRRMVLISKLYQALFISLHSCRGLVKKY